VDPVAAERDDQRLVPHGREGRQVGLGEPSAAASTARNQALTDFPAVERVRAFGGDGPDDDGLLVIAIWDALTKLRFAHLQFPSRFD
jgi:hypothetical protein